MKRCFVQCAEVTLEPGADDRAPGGAVTMALCGSWDHEGECRWPHETSATWEERRGKVRVVFVADEAEEAEVRALVDGALSGGACVGPDGKRSQWEVAGVEAGTVSEGDVAWSARFTGGRDGE